MKRLMLCFLLVLTWCGAAAAADLVSTWKDKEGTVMTLSYRDKTHVRMDTEPNSYMLMSGEKVYMVTKEDGKWSAMDMDQMSGMMKAFGGSAKETAQQKTTFKSTGRSETVAGYKGMVYATETRDAAGKIVEKNEVVLSKDADVVRMNEAWMAFASAMARFAGPDMSRAIDSASKQAYQSGYGGILRVENDIVLTSLKKTSLAATYFDLPQGTEMGSVPDAEERKHEAVDKATSDESKGSTVEGVQEGVKSMFNKIFNK